MTTTGIAARPAPAGRAVARQEASRRPQLRQLPYLVSRAYFLAALILVLQALFPGVAWFGRAADLYSTFFIPIDSSGIGLAGFSIIVGGAIARRKRAAWWVTVVISALWLFALLVLVVFFTVLILAGIPIGVGNTLLLARFAFNLAAMGVVLTLLILGRDEFRARRQPGNIRKALLTLIVGLVISFGLGFLLVTVFPGQMPQPRGRIAWLVAQVFSLDTDDVAATTGAPPTWTLTVTGLFVSASLAAAMIVLTRSQRRAAFLAPDDERQVRALLPSSAQDSLAYFATRRDKSVIFGKNQRSAVTYRVELGVCLASSDPLGQPDHWPSAISAWMRLVEEYGWTPAVIGASERGARAYAHAGLRVIRLGDEAILAPSDFSLDGREMRPVRQAVSRLERLGYRTRIRRHGDIDPAELATLITRVDAWRDTETERGFSMALSRLGDPADGDCLMIEALFPPGRGPAGEVAGILSFVPWGAEGYSLDVMRRHPRADNGVTELMVCALMAAAGEGRVGDRTVRRVSLNFAVFRSAFEEGARIGAGPILRVWRRLLLVASRWWQIESLYRSNVKYRPDWEPRFLCFAETRDIALVGAATGVAEGFIDLPSFLRRPEPPAVLAPGTVTPQLPTGPGPTLPVGVVGTEPAVTGWVARDAHPTEIGTDPQPGASAPARPKPGDGIDEQSRNRMAVRERLLADGLDPYPPSFRPTVGCGRLELGVRVRLAGRVLRVRDHGGVIFVTVQDWTGQAQLMLERDALGAAELRRFRGHVDLGDHVGVDGSVITSERGERSVAVSSWMITAKSLHPMPDKYRGLTDPEARVRQRYLDLTTNVRARRQLAARSAAIRAVRESLQDHGFIEVETPMLQTIHGGANARPFRTHINAYNLPLYLRIAPELYLKRLMVGGVDRIFEIGRNFRNEGADATHNPEFTMLEAYQAYGDYTTMRVLVTELITRAARSANDSTLLRGLDHEGREHEVDLADAARSWRVITVNDAISAALGEQVDADSTAAQLHGFADRLGIGVDPQWSRGAVLLELYEHLVEHRTVEPTFYADFPAEVSPLTRPHRDDPRLAERWDLVAFGAEIGTAYSELVDPVEQRARLTAQSLLAAEGDPEAMELDEDFLTALEYAMPPSGGLGMGVDRLIMMLTQTSIRETITFPLVRPRTTKSGSR